LPAEEAYDLWARTYDEQEDNLLLHLDHELTFGNPTATADWMHRRILDFGCGTGRHWQELQAFAPQRLAGVDVSAEMLRRLKERLPEAEVYQIRDERLAMFADGEFDVVLSNLTIGYVKEPVRLVREWSRVLRPGGQVVVTDLHPAALARGARRTFVSGGRSIEIRNYSHDVQSLEDAGRACGLKFAAFAERRVDQETRVFYERAGALPIYDRMEDTPLVYRLCLTKE
jgi:SAM-dependent methyltransferase